MFVDFILFNAKYATERSPKVGLVKLANRNPNPTMIPKRHSTA